MTIITRGLLGAAMLVTRGLASGAAPTGPTRTPNPQMATSRRIGPDPSKATSERK